MRKIAFLITLLAAMLIGACHYVPQDLAPLAESIDQQVSGRTTAWLVGGDIVVIDVAGSPLFERSGPEIEAVVTAIAKEVIEFTDSDLESIAITFHQGEVSDVPEKMREFIFLVRDGSPLLQPLLDFDATGPLTLAEVQELFVDPMDASSTIVQKECVLLEIDKLAREAGDPELLDPATVEFLPDESWNDLDAFGRRLILAQAITTKALFDCASL